MDSITVGQIKSKDVNFLNGNRARLVNATSGARMQDIITALQINPPQALILVIGGANEIDEDVKPQLTELLTLGVAQAASRAGALIIDGGTSSGIMALMGKSVAVSGHQSQLLGVAPTGRITYPDNPIVSLNSDLASLDHNHSHFVLIDGSEWGDETDTLYRLAAELAHGRRAITILASGGPIAKKETLRSARLGYPIIAIEGSGRFADTLARSQQTTISDPIVGSIGVYADIYRFPLSGSPVDLESLISYLFREETSVKYAWEKFALYDANASKHQRSFRSFMITILSLNILGTALALLQTTFRLLGMPHATFIDVALRFVIIIIPISSSVLLTISNRFNLGNKWVYLRSSAETIKSNIFRYRTRAGIYNKSRDPNKSVTPEAKLAASINKINRRLMQTQVNLSALHPYKGPIPPSMYASTSEDNGVNRLTPEQYIKIRIGDQLNYFTNRTIALEKQLHRLQWSIYVLGGVGTILAAIGLELWIALTTTLATTLISYLEYQQTESNLSIYNQTASDLSDIRDWWTALSFEDKQKSSNIDRLVESTERVLRGEISNWLQNVKFAISELPEASNKDKDQDKKDSE